MYDVHVVHKDTDVRVFYGTFSTLGAAQDFASDLDIDAVTEEISITFCVVLT